jgi:hypothetical protein
MRRLVSVLVVLLATFATILPTLAWSDRATSCCATALALPMT